MARIRITPEQVRNVAQQFHSASQESQGIVDRLNGAMGQIEPEWEGITKQRFWGEYEQWRGSMNQFTRLLDSIGGQLDAIASRFAAADQQ